MEKLNCKSLMIGDWVMVYPWDETPWKPQKITDINFHSWEGTDFCDSVGVEGWDELSLDQIKPIPITPEILEKNGFTQYEPQGYGLYVKDKNGAGLYNILWQGESYNYDLEIAAYTYPFGEFNKRNIKYVHQLQHALRLCGIEKEIEL